MAIEALLLGAMRIESAPCLNAERESGPAFFKQQLLLIPSREYKSARGPRA